MLRRIAKIALALVGTLLALYAGFAMWMYWQLRTITDVTEYEELLARWTPGVAEHFPRHIPDSANLVALSYFPGFLQGGAHFQLRLRLPAGEIARVEQTVRPSAKHVYDGGGFFDHYNDDQSKNVPIATLRTADQASSNGDFPHHYRMYVLDARHGDTMGAPWNHGMTRGVAVSTTASEVVYWIEDWQRVRPNNGVQLTRPALLYDGAALLSCWTPNEAGLAADAAARWADSGESDATVENDSPILRFEWSVRALAQPAEVQLKLYPSFVCHADELALEFDECRQVAQPMLAGRLDQRQGQLIETLDSYLQSISGQVNAELWTEEAMRTSAEWKRVRGLANEILAAMGWSTSPPPLERGAIYIGSDA